MLSFAMCGLICLFIVKLINTADKVFKYVNLIVKLKKDNFLITVLLLFTAF